MSDTIRWGIIGTGSIAKKFATGLAALADAELSAIGSRASSTADAFGETFGVPRRYGSYQELVNDPDVDAVYVATPHPFHLENTLQALHAGKAVLCEKPFSVNADQAIRMVECSRRQQCFLMEAMWTRFLPAVSQAIDWVKQGRIGEPRMLAADFGFRIGWNPEGRLLNPALAGGALLDVGAYVVSLASWVLGGAPLDVASFAHIGETGVDEQAAIALKYPEGKLALLSCAVRTNTPQQARIEGTEGRVTLDTFWRSTHAVLERGGKVVETIDLPLEGTGYHYQAAEVMRCLRDGLLESPIMPLDESYAIMKTLDAIRAQWGLRYPME